jgi:primosomal protein N' (replication factor Y)
MDVDSTATKGSHDELVERFRSGDADILLGTQMVAKGLDFPEVTLVGVISADTSMHMPDFRAAERSFQLLTQVAGRSGRGTTPGEVVIQTLLSDSPVLREAADQDYEAFADREMQIRNEAGFPPFGRLIVFLWRGADESAVARAATQGTLRLNALVGAAARVLGPASAPLARLRDQYRWHALLCGTAANSVHGIARAALPPMRRIAGDEKVALSVNVDPLGMM